MVSQILSSISFFLSFSIHFCCIIVKSTSILQFPLFFSSFFSQNRNRNPNSFCNFLFFFLTNPIVSQDKSSISSVAFYILYATIGNVYLFYFITSVHCLQGLALHTFCQFDLDVPYQIKHTYISPILILSRTFQFYISYVHFLTLLTFFIKQLCFFCLCFVEKHRNKTQLPCRH